MAGATTTTIDDILREVYADKIEDAVRTSHVLLTRWESKLSDVVIKGKSFRITCPLRTGLNEGVGARAEDTALPDPKNVTYDAIQPTLASIYGSIRLTGHALDVSEGANANAFASALDEEINGMVTGLMLEMARYIQLDGSGALAQANGLGSGSTSLTVDNPDTRYLEVGMVIDGYTAKSGGTISINSVTITGINRTTNVVTLGASSTWADDDWIFRENNHGVTQPYGLQSIVDDGTVTADLYGIDRTVAGNEFWQAQLKSNGAAAFTEVFMQECVDEAEINGVDARLTIGSCDHQTRRYIFEVLSAQKRFVNQQTLKGGFSALTYEGGSNPIPIVADRFNWPGYLYFLDESKFFFGWAPKVGGTWMTRDGSILKLDQASGRKDAYIGYYYMRTQLAVKNCRNQVRGYSYGAPA